MNRKLLAILLFAIGTACILNASEQEDKIFKDLEESFNALSGKGSIFQDRTYGLTEEETKYWSDKSRPHYEDGQLEHMRLLRRYQNEQLNLENTRPSTAPAKIQQESVYNKLHRGLS